MFETDTPHAENMNRSCTGAGTTTPRRGVHSYGAMFLGTVWLYAGWWFFWSSSLSPTKSAAGLSHRDKTATWFLHGQCCRQQAVASAARCRSSRQGKSNTKCCKDPLPRVAFQTDCYCISIRVVVLVAFWHLWGMRPYPQSLLG